MKRFPVKKLSILLAALAAAAPLPAATKAAVFQVRGWTCASCAAATRIALRKLDGVEDVETDAGRSTACVTYDDAKITTDRMAAAIRRLGYEPTVQSGGGALCPRPDAAPARAAAPAAGVATDRVGFFEVPLECGAAADLGCGSAAKPILAELSRDPRVSDARINRVGTTLAVVWKSAGVRSDAAVEALFEKHRLAAAALQGARRSRAAEEFREGAWYGAADVDRLSEHEARVIAARLVQRARLEMAPSRRAALTEDLAVVIAGHLTRTDEECDAGRDAMERELLRVAGRHLSAAQVAALRKAGEQGVQALAGEER